MAQRLETDPLDTMNVRPFQRSVNRRNEASDPENDGPTTWTGASLNPVTWST
jgi:hypothetical protein